MDWGWWWRRLASAVLVLFIVTFLTFLIIDLLPGRTENAILGPAASPAAVEQVRDDLNLDEPLLSRYGTWLRRAISGDLGVTYPDGRVVSVVLREGLPASVELLFLTQIVAVGFALPSALVAGRREGGRLDRTLSSMSFIAVALPQLALGIMLLTVFAQKLNWFPASEYTHISDGLFENIRSLTLPTITLAIPLAGIYYRVLRTDVVTTLRSDHIAFARAMGLSSRRVLWRRALRPSSLTLVSVVGLNTALLLGGVAIVESIYSIPGIGGTLVRSVLTRQVTLVQGTVLVIAVVYVVSSLLVDVTLMWLDPRVRLSGRAV
jgi:peptide/nickel transport system permease protein